MANAELLTVLAKYLTAIVAIIMLGATVVGSIAFYKTNQGAAKTFSLLIQRANAVQMLAVILIALAACALRILDLIESEAVVALLSGIAGYVLGGATKNKVGEEES